MKMEPQNTQNTRMDTGEGRSWWRNILKAYSPLSVRGTQFKRRPHSQKYS